MNEYVEVESVSWFSRIRNSIIGIFIGVLLFIASFVVLYLNEGRKDLSKILSSVKSFSSDVKIPQEYDGKLVCIEGSLQPREEITDGILKPVKVLILKRKVEVYAWIQRVKIKRKKALGGKLVKIKKYRYEKKWVDKVPDVSRYKVKKYAVKVEKEFEDKVLKPEYGYIGKYLVKLDDIQFPSTYPLDIKPDMLLDNNFRIYRKIYLYKEGENPDNPQIGDNRIVYYVLESVKPASVFGKFNYKTGIITKYNAKKLSIFRVFRGDKQKALEQLHMEYKLTLWLFRVIGFVLMWVSLMMVFDPISVVLDFIPFLGDVSGFFITVITFIVSFILSSITILISIILHNPIIILIIGLLIIGVLGYLYKNKLSNKKQKLPPVPE